MAEKKSCFIIMPITTPKPFIEKFRDGAEHFKHVLDCLFIPCAEKAGYKPIPPKAKGSDIIQAEIIKNLETSDLVLCDMSCLNPNVFFEFGIRTSLNKPVCVVKDELTDKVPFDTSIMNYQEYSSSLESWILDKEISKLSDHLTASQERSKGKNTLWKYFGFRSEAQPSEGIEGTDDKLDYLALQIESLRQKVGGFEPKSPVNDFSSISSKGYEKIVRFIEKFLPIGVYIRALLSGTHDDLLILYEGELTESDKIDIEKSVFDVFSQKIQLNRKYY
ncbi:MAG: hypothetical protein HQ580_10425 [Planctomycetes bacterium]|nr:hypothetical protein [Planctomycetota bacterium]